jgi:hypothetical protein
MQPRFRNWSRDGIGTKVCPALVEANWCHVA